MPHAMPRRFDVVTFDCYGTLIDWESGIADAFLSAAPQLRREEVLREYARAEAEVERERYRAYREVLTVSASRTLRALGVDNANGAFLPESLPHWTPFPDTNAALERLRHAGYALGILSNVDDDLLSATRRHFTVEFELLVTAQQVRSYKPAPGHFLAARERLGAKRWLHAAQSSVHDIVPANALGIATAWVNRHTRRALPGGTPTFVEVRDLTALADSLAD